MDIREKLLSLKDEKYKEFTAALIPTVDSDKIIGVRMPEIRNLCKLLSEEEKAAFIKDLPHKYHEENLLHACIIGKIKDFDKAVLEAENFLPYIDNWAVCDSLSPAVFKREKGRLLQKIKTWLKSDKTYTVRFALKMIMTHYLDDDFKPEYLELAAKTRADEYYLSMMIAWLFATALAKQYDSAIVYIENRRLDRATHNRAIQKSVESYRIDNTKKAYLKTLNIKENKNA